MKLCLEITKQDLEEMLEHARNTSLDFYHIKVNTTCTPSKTDNNAAIETLEKAKNDTTRDQDVDFKELQEVEK